MTLDINPKWVTFNFFDHPGAAPSLAVVRGHKLIDTKKRPADRYLSKESRGLHRRLVAVTRRPPRPRGRVYDGCPSGSVCRHGACSDGGRPRRDRSVDRGLR